MKKILRITALILTVVFTVIFASASGRASLFIGDGEWESDSLLPFIETEGKKLVPAAAFGEIEGITVKYSERLGSLLIANDEKYLSYSLNFGSCIDEAGTVTETEIYRYGGEIYLAPDFVCEKFGLNFETAFAPDGYLAARISDGGASLEFSELLSLYTVAKEQEIPFLYNPEGKTVEGRFVYPFILLPTPSNAAAIISLTDGHGLTIVIRPSEISSYAEIIADVYASGNAVAFYMSAADAEDTSAFKKDMDAANEVLFATVGKTSRTYICTEVYGDTEPIDGYFKKSCAMNLISYDLVNEREVSLTLNDMPAVGRVNFTLASDSYSRSYYLSFFRQFNRFEMLRSMPANEATSDK